MTVAELLARARSTIGHKTRNVPEPDIAGMDERALYAMGSGVITPDAHYPWGADGACDCSAASDWAVGVPKFKAGRAPLWYNTDAIWLEAKRGGPVFARIDTFEVGCLLVYPSAATAGRPGPNVGHVGVVMELDALGAARWVWHCSSSSFRRTGDAFAITRPGVFSSVAATLACWAATIERDPEPVAACA